MPTWLAYSPHRLFGSYGFKMVCIYFSCIHLIGKIPLNFSTFCKPTVSPRSSVFLHLDLASAGLHAVNTSNAIDPISTSPTNSNPHATITDNAILTVLNACFHADMPYMWLGTSHLLAINPCRAISAVNNVSAWEYEKHCYKHQQTNPCPVQAWPALARLS